MRRSPSRFKALGFGSHNIPRVRQMFSGIRQKSSQMLSQTSQESVRCLELFPEVSEMISETSPRLVGSFQKFFLESVGCFRRVSRTLPATFLESVGCFQKLSQGQSDASRGQPDASRMFTEVRQMLPECLPGVLRCFQNVSRGQSDSSRMFTGVSLMLTECFQRSVRCIQNVFRR
jgi:hypothetical protein